MDAKWRKQSNPIGWGTHAKVYLAVPIDDNSRNSSIIAVKSKNNDFAYNLRREAQVLRQLRECPNVIRCFGEDVSASCNGETYDYNLLLEYAPAGNLERLIYRSDKIKESDVAFYAYQILTGFLHVHDKGFVHSDLKPENVLVFPTPHDGKFLLKLADFGVSTLAGKMDDDDEDEDEPFCPHHCRGSLPFASPEYLKTGRHMASDDIWSLGCILIEMFTADPAWLCKDSNDLIYQILDGKPEIPECISEVAKDFLRKCFYRKDIEDNEERWTARMLLDHPFVLSNDDVSFLQLEIEGGDDVLSCRTNPLGLCFDQWISTNNLFIY